MNALSRAIVFRVPILAMCFSLSPALIQAQQNTVPTVTFTCDFPGAEPAHYEITVSPDGHGSYTSRSNLSSSHDSVGSSDAAHDADENYRADFNISESTSTRIFDLAKRANYFAGQLDSGKKKVASTGAKTLSYKAASQSTQASYNYSSIPAIQELTTIFQSLSTTLDFGRRLDYDLHYQKLALDEELKRMEDMAAAGSLKELSSAAPILRKIAEDPTVINVSRSRAQRLLARAGTEAK
jgi:hypothetical protein